MVNLLGGKWSQIDMVVLSNLIHVDSEMPFCIVQTVESGLAFIKTAAIGDKLANEQLLRLHVFGEGGDFTLRYDDGEYHWRFVGNIFSQSDIGGDAYPTPLILGAEQSALLWGEFDANRQRWYENIVGSAQLNYPAEEQYTRTTIHAKQVMDSQGEIVAFWTYKLAAYNSQ